MDTLTVIRTYFESLQLPKEVGDLYFALHRYGPQSISQLSRTSKIERTKIYRLSGLLLEYNLIEIENDYHHDIYKAAPISNLEILLAQKEQQLQSLQTNLPLLQQALASAAGESHATSVQFYRGAEGVRQMLWNETRATTEIVGILHEKIQIKTQNKFFERWVQRCNEQGLQFRGIISDHFIETQHIWKGDTHNHIQNWEGRYVSPEVFRITHSTIVYDDTTAYFSWNDTEIFGVEIHSDDIANTQRQFFDLLWAQSKPNNRSTR